MHFRTLSFGCGGSCDGKYIDVVDIQVFRLHVGRGGNFHDNVVFLGVLFERAADNGVDTLLRVGVSAAPQFGARVTEEDIGGDALPLLE